MFRTRMLHARSRWGAWGAGPILAAASFSHSPGRSPAHPGWVEAAAPIAVALSDVVRGVPVSARLLRSEEHTSELQSLMRISYAVFCLKKKTNTVKHTQTGEQQYATQNKCH